MEDKLYTISEAMQKDSVDYGRIIKANFPRRKSIKRSIYNGLPLQTFRNWFEAPVEVSKDFKLSLLNFSFREVARLEETHIENIVESVLYSKENRNRKYMRGIVEQLERAPKATDIIQFIYRKDFWFKVILYTKKYEFGVVRPIIEYKTVCAVTVNR